LQPVAADVDRQTRLLIRAAEPALRQWLAVPQLDRSLVGTLYVRQHDILQQSAVAGSSERQQLVEQLSLVIFLTATAWQLSPQPDVDFLARLRQIVAAALTPDAVSFASVAEAFQEDEA
jgi:hypothetical protein